MPYFDYFCNTPVYEICKRISLQINFYSFSLKVYYCCDHLYMESNLNEFEQEPRLRPTLLTVLCILTFIGSGLTIIKNAYSYSMAAKSAKIFSSAVVKRY